MDIIPGWLKDAWEARQERQRLHAHYKEQHTKLNQAIEDQDPSAFREILEQTEKIETFLSHRKNDLLKNAVRAQGIDMYETVSEVCGSPSGHYTFYDHSPLMPGAGMHWSYTTPLIIYAIQNDAADIAMKLAQDPNTNIYVQATYSKSTYHSGGFLSTGHTERKNKEYPIARIQAEEKGMSAVAAVLAQREAADLTAKAQELKA